jgi:hypothetical protein
MNDREKSHSAIVAGKPTNNVSVANTDAAEPVEPRAGTKRNASEQSTHRTRGRGPYWPMRRSSGTLPAEPNCAGCGNRSGAKVSPRLRVAKQLSYDLCTLGVLLAELDHLQGGNALPL